MFPSAIRHAATFKQITFLSHLKVKLRCHIYYYWLQHSHILKVQNKSEKSHYGATCGLTICYRCSHWRLSYGKLFQKRFICRKFIPRGVGVSTIDAAAA